MYMDMNMYAQTLLLLSNLLSLHPCIHHPVIHPLSYIFLSICLPTCLISVQLRDKLAHKHMSELSLISINVIWEWIHSTYMTSDKLILLFAHLLINRHNQEFGHAIYEDTSDSIISNSIDNLSIVYFFIPIVAV